MKKWVLPIAFMLLLTIFAVPILAQIEYEEIHYTGIASRAIVMYPGIDVPLFIEGINIKKSTELPACDLLLIFLIDGDYILPWIVVSDNTEVAAMEFEMFGGITDFFEMFVVDDKDLEVYSWSKVELNVPIEAALHPFGANTIHPFTMRLKTQGPGVWTEDRVPEHDTLPSGYWLSIEKMSHEAASTQFSSDNGEITPLATWLFRHLHVTITKPVD